MSTDAPAAEAPHAADARTPYGQLMPVTVHFDDLDALGLLHNARYPLLVERAWTHFWVGHGFVFTGDWAAAGDVCNAVKELRVSYQQPVTRPGGYAVHLWIDRLGRTGLTYGFRFCSADGGRTYAQGQRVLVRLDADTLRPTPWTDGFRAAAATLMPPAPA